MNVGMRRGAWAAGFALLAVLTVASCADSAQPQAGAPAPSPATLVAHTATHTFAPYDANGDLTVPVNAHRTGRCWSSSITVPAARAYRCFAGNRILDPCFAPPHTAKARTLACVADPWSPAVLLRVTKPLPARTPGPGRNRPWALLLGTGAKCVASSGTVPSVAGVNLPYDCSDGTFAAVGAVIGKQLHAYDAAPKAAGLRVVAVRALWRG
jgi:hypothetical protein